MKIGWPRHGSRESRIADLEVGLVLASLDSVSEGSKNFPTYLTVYHESRPANVVSLCEMYVGSWLTKELD